MLLLATLTAALALSPAHGAVVDRGIFDKTYDYIIVGGGTAGLALAARLSENPNLDVAVIEPGIKYQVSNIAFSSTPGADVLFIGSSMSDSQPLVDWNLETEPLTGGLGRKVHYARGKCLGGSSARNFMIYQRPDRGSLDMWASLVGDESYSWSNFEPFFRKSVTFTPPRNDVRDPNATVTWSAEAFDAGAGPLSVTYPNYGGPLTSYLLPGLGEALGIPLVDGFSGGNIHGRSYAPVTVQAKSGNRESSQTSFLDEAEHRGNLHVHKMTQAERVLFDEERNAVGVEVGWGRKFMAGREVILSAGAFHSPQLLMLSGIGPAHHLREHGINVIADRPGVGQNLTDHIFFSPTYRVKVQTFTALANNLLKIGWEFLTNFSRNRGVLTNNVSDMIAFEDIPREDLKADTLALLDRYPESWPDVEYMSAPGRIGDFSSLFKNQPKDGYQYGAMLAALVNPQSRGSVTLRSNRISDKPVIDAGWLTHPADADVAVQAYKRVRKVFASDAVRPVLAHPEEYHPGPSVATDEEILHQIRRDMMTVWHASTTCRMGRADDPTAVVDSKARVIGVNRLRVVDASAFALLPPGHPQSVVYALAEKIAADILAGIKEEEQYSLDNNWWKREAKL